MASGNILFVMQLSQYLKKNEKHFQFIDQLPWICMYYILEQKISHFEPRQIRLLQFNISDIISVYQRNSIYVVWFECTKETNDKSEE